MWRKSPEFTRTCQAIDLYYNKMLNGMRELLVSKIRPKATPPVKKYL